MTFISIYIRVKGSDVGMVCIYPFLLIDSRSFILFELKNIALINAGSRQVGTGRQRSGKGAIRKRFQFQKRDGKN